MAVFGGLRLRDALDEIIRCHVRADTRGAGAFAGPREMAVVTIKLLRQDVDVCEKPDEKIRESGFVRVLRVINAQ